VHLHSQLRRLLLAPVRVGALDTPSRACPVRVGALDSQQRVNIELVLFTRGRWTLHQGVCHDCPSSCWRQASPTLTARSSPSGPLTLEFNRKRSCMRACVSLLALLQMHVPWHVIMHATHLDVWHQSCMCTYVHCHVCVCEPACLLACLLACPRACVRHN